MNYLEEEILLESLDYLREFNIMSLFFRLALSMLFGGLIGLERGRKRRAAGFRTYMLVSLGASLTMLLGQYNYVMMEKEWVALSGTIGIQGDMSRVGAQVINGIGFLGAGTIIVTDRQEVKGLTTAAGLWASACMGLATGAGFYECVMLAFIFVFLCIRVLPIAESYIVENARNLNIYVQFMSLDDISEIVTRIKTLDVHIYEVDIIHGRIEDASHPSAVFTIRLNKRMPHIQVLAAISELDSVCIIEEI